MQYKKDEVKKRILKAAFSEFEKVGFQKASVMKISSDAKVTIGNLYRYFSGKEEIFECIVEKAYNELPKKMLEYFSLDFEGYEDKGEGVRQIAASLAENYKLYRREVKLLFEKSQGTKFVNFGEAIKTNLSHIAKFGIYGRQTLSDMLIPEIVADNFLRGLFVIFEVAEEERLISAIKELIDFYFGSSIYKKN